MSDNNTETSTEDECILYELLVYAEWKQEPELSERVIAGALPEIGIRRRTSGKRDDVIFRGGPPPSSDRRNTPCASRLQRLGAVFQFQKFQKLNDSALPLPHSGLNVLKYFKRNLSVTDDVLRFLLHQLPWQFAVGQNGKVVAILQESVLEIRISRDEFSSVVGKASVARDAFPQWRKVLWSPDCSMLAVAHSNGSVSFYDLLGSNMFTIYPELYKAEKDCPHPIASILFLQPRIKSPKWSYEFTIIDFNGILHNYLVSPIDGFQENHTFSFHSQYHCGVTAVSYHSSHKLLFVAGYSNANHSESLEEHGSSYGLSAWRLLNDYPYYRMALSVDEEQAMSHSQWGFWSWTTFVKKNIKQSIILKIQVSPKGKLLVCLHSCGSISVWHLPSLRMFRIWSLCDQPGYNVRNPLLSNLGDRKKYRFNVHLPDSDFYPVDANWWSDKAVIIARRSGAVGVCSVRNLHNLLGDSPEFLSGEPQVSALCNECGFLALECEVVLTSIKRPNEDISLASTESESSDDDDDEDNSIINQSTALVKSLIYIFTDMERFQPKRKRPKLLHKTYRLLGLKSTTPEELYTRKIDNEEYGDALDLARAYNLDCDLVYQKQWRKSSVSVAAIHDYLSKIKKRSWVLKECIERVPETFLATLELLEFGLKGINAETIIAVGEGSDGDYFISKSNETEYFEHSGEQDYKTRENLLKSKIDPSNLKPQQKDLIKYRQILLHYLDMLRTYELILGGPQYTDTFYDFSFYEKFRSTPLVVSVIEFAREGNYEAVEYMFTYHGDKVLNHWQPVVSNFPETMNPFNYKNLLPECIVNDGVFMWEQSKLRERDYCEEREFFQAIGVDEDDGSSFIYSEDPALKAFNCQCQEITPDLLTKWYTYRIRQIECQSRMVDNALNLIKLAKERNVQGLDDLHYQLLTLEALVYEVNEPNITLSQLQTMSNLDQSKLLMSKSSEATFVEDVKHLLVPFLIRCEKQKPGLKMKLLKDYLISVSTSDLVKPLMLFEYLHGETFSILVSSFEELLDLQIDCIYAYQNPDQFDVAHKILNCSTRVPMGSQNSEAWRLQTRVEELKCDLAAAEILLQYEVPKSLMFIKDTKSDTSSAIKILTRMARNLSKRTVQPTKLEWDKLLQDILTLHYKVFKSVDVRLCYEIFAETLLSSGNKTNILAAASILECHKSGSKKAHFDSSVALVLKVSREYFDSAGSLLDNNMELAKACLHLILDDHEEVQENLDLIASLQLLSDFGLQMLPLQVRQCSDRMRLVETCVRKKPSSYRNCQSLLQLAEKLRVSGRDNRQREGRVLVVVAEAAFEVNDFEYCAEICLRLVENMHAVGWEIVQRLGQCNEFHDIELRCSLLAFAMLYCNPEMLDSLVTSRCLLEAQLLHKDVTTQVCDDELDATSGDEEEFSDALTSPMTPKREFPPVSSIINAVGTSTELLRKKTYHLLRNVGNKNFWKNTFSDWAFINDKMSMTDESNEDFKLQGLPAFYGSLSPNCWHSSIDTKYDRFSMPDVNNHTLSLCQTLLRTSLLESSAESLPSCDNTAVLLQLAEHILPEDSPLGLMHLLAVQDISKIHSCFQNLPITSISIQLANYCYAILGYRDIYGVPNDRKFMNDLYLFPPSMLIDHMIDLIELSNAKGLWADYLSQNKKIMVDLVQGEQLNALGCGIDLQRFATDAQYRQDSILGLPLTVDPKRFQVALDLGARHNVPTGQIAAIHISTLLLNTEEITIAELKKRIMDPELIDLLKQDANLVIKRLQDLVYPNIGGTDHQLLTLYYTVLQSVADNLVTYSLTPKEHIKLLMKVKATSAGIDYKKLTEMPNTFLDIVSPILKKENVGLVAKLLKGLPANLNCTVQIGTLYGSWAQLEFFQGLGNKTDFNSFNSNKWMEQYETCSKNFLKMGAIDFVNFAKGICFSERSVDFMTKDCRKAILNNIISFCEQKGKEYTSSDWQEAASNICQWALHIERISSHKFEELNGNFSPELQFLLRQLDISRGEAVHLQKVFRMLVCSSIPLKILDVVCSLFPQPNVPLKQQLNELLNHSLEGIRNGSDAEAQALLPAILRRLQELIDQGEKLQDCLWDKLQPLCKDQHLSPRLRLQIVQLLQSSRAGPEGNISLLLSYHAQAILSIGWSDNDLHLMESDLSSTENRNTFLLKLLEQTFSWQQIIMVKGFLEALPEFQNSSESNRIMETWTCLLSKILNVRDGNSDQAVNVIKDIVRKRKISEEKLINLVSEKQNSGCFHHLLLVCLLPEYTYLHQMAVTLLIHCTNLQEYVLHKPIMTLLIQRGLLPKFVQTPLYKQLVNHLVSGSDPELPPVSSVASQLAAAGFVNEARALDSQSNRSRSVLSTAFQLARRTWAAKD